MHKMLIVYWITFVLFLILRPILCQDTYYDVGDDNSHGVRISGNDQFAVYIVNRDGGFIIVYTPFVPMKKCSYWNTNTDLFVYSVAVIFNNDNATSNRLYTFVQVAEQTSTQDIYFSIITLNTSLCDGMS